MGANPHKKKQYQRAHRRVSTAFSMAFSAAVGLSSGAPAFAQDASYTQSIDTASDYQIHWGEPRLSPEVIGGLGAGLMRLGGVAYVRRRPIAVPCVLAGGVAVTMLINPQLIQSRYDILPTEIILAVDRSESNVIDGREALTKNVEESLLQQLSAMGDGIHVTVVPFGGDEDGSITDFMSELGQTQSLYSERLGGVIVLSDGNLTNIPEQLNLPENTPLHAMMSGQKGDFDRVLSMTRAPGYGVLGDTADVHVKIDDLGRLTQNPTYLLVDIENSAGQKQQIQAVVGEETIVTLPLDSPGEMAVTFSVPGLEGEVTKRNNGVTHTMNVIREDFNILMLTGETSLVMRNLREALKADGNSNLVHVALLRRPYQFDPTAQDDLALVSVPTGEIFRTALPFYDLIVLDQTVNAGSFSRRRLLQPLLEHVQQGAAMLVIAGDEHKSAHRVRVPLYKEMMPVQSLKHYEAGLFRPQLTDLGLKHPVTRSLQGRNEAPEASASWGPWAGYNHVEITEPDARVLMQHPDGTPLLLVQETSGATQDFRMATLLSDSFWLWRNGYQGGGPSQELLLNTIRWLTAYQALEAERLDLSTPDVETLRIRRQTLYDGETPGVADITRPDGAVQSFAFDQKVGPGLWQVDVPVQTSGSYRVAHRIAGWDDGPVTASVQAGQDLSQELHKVLSHANSLRPLVEETSGRILSMHDGIPQLVAQNDQNSTSDQISVLSLNITDHDVLKARSSLSIPLPLGGLLIAGLMVWAYKRDGGITFFKKQDNKQGGVDAAPQP